MTTRNIDDQRTPLRVAVIQFAPILGNPEENIRKANEICARLQPKSVDLVCLPEMIFTGYVFANSQAIAPYLEDPQSGITSQFCTSLARKLGCYVVAGYPEILKEHERSQEDDTCVVGANSAVLVGPNGEAFSYRKSNLFETDKTWSKAGDGFRTYTLPNLPPGLQDLSIAICMDLNPFHSEPWTLDGGPYELADYCRSTIGKPRTKVLVLLNAWLDSHNNPNTKWDLNVLNYWTSRLRPLWDTEHCDNEQLRRVGEETKETIVIVCNRCGSDKDVLFAGTSCVMRLREGAGEPDLLGIMGRQEEGMRVWAL